jgi:AcrR family transcriptional regulator
MNHVFKTLNRMIKSRRSAARPPPRRRELPADTRTRILDTAERLFAERGVDAVSVRAILKEAGVNVALAHYHFGSREGLIEELLRTRVTAHEGELIRAIEQVDALGKAATLEDVLRAYFAPAARVVTERPALGKLLAQIQVSANPQIRGMGRDAMRPAFYRLGEALLSRVPGGIEPRRLLLRFYMVVSIPSVFLATWDLVLASARRRLDADAQLDAEVLTEELVAFCAAGLRAGADEAGRRTPSTRERT